MRNHLDHDEETFNDKLKKGAGAFTLVGTGLLSLLHVLSHVVPALAVLGFALGPKSGMLYGFVSNEWMQFAFIPFVFLSFWYMYRDHKHHKHEHELRKENERLMKLLKKRK